MNTGKKFNRWEKIIWRLKFFLLNFWRLDPGVLFLLLGSEKKRGAEFLFKFLEKKGLLKHHLEGNILEYKKYKFKFAPEDLEAIRDFISIFNYREKYFLKNFRGEFSFEGAYERSGLEIKEGDCVIDAGANIGLFSVLAADLTGDKGSVWAFEPIPAAAKILSENVALNQKKNINVVNNGLGKETASIDFFLSKSLGNCSSIFEEGSEKIELPIISLDDFVEENSLTKVDFIKADIEGMERDLLLGAKRTIARFKPKLAICIYHLSDDPEVLPRIIKEICPEYKIVSSDKKLFAQVDA